MEINTVPRFDSQDAKGTRYSKIPKLQFPVDADGRAILVQDVTYYSKAALHDAFKAWRDGGPACSGRFDEKATWKPKLTTRTTRFDQGGKVMAGVERSFDTKIFEGNVWGLQWVTNDLSPKGLFPQYYKHVGDERVAVPAAETCRPKRSCSLRNSSSPRRECPTPRPPLRLGEAWPETRPLHRQARGWFRGDLFVVSFRRSAVLPAIRLERGEEGEAASVRGETPRGLAD